MGSMKGSPDSQQQRRGGNVPLCDKVDIGIEKIVLGPYLNLEVLSWMKLAATGACGSSSTEKVFTIRKQILILRKILTLNSCKAHQRKRKLDLFLEEKLEAPGNLYDQEIPNMKTYSPQGNPSPLLDSVENVRPIHLPSLDHNESVHGSNMSSRKTVMNVYVTKLRQPPRLENLFGYCKQTKFVPIGPRFQADIPEWADPTCKETTAVDVGNSEELKWLGTKVWPPEGHASEFKGQDLIGKGRSDSCSCRSRGSKICIRRHVLEQRLVLKDAPGPVFFSWKFDDMGVEVAKSWTPKEKKRFFMQSGSSLDKKTWFWQIASRWLPSKSREDIVSYYFNVFLPRVKAGRKRKDLKGKGKVKRLEERASTSSLLRRRY